MNRIRETTTFVLPLEMVLPMMKKHAKGRGSYTKDKHDVHEEDHPEMYMAKISRARTRTTEEPKKKKQASKKKKEVPVEKKVVPKKKETTELRRMTMEVPARRKLEGAEKSQEATVAERMDLPNVWEVDDDDKKDAESQKI